MFNLMIILLAVINSEINDSNNYKIAKYIIENIDVLENCSITELAKRCYVSNSSISRFCRDIGLRDYNELRNQVAKYQVAHEAAQRKYQYKLFNPKQPCQSYVDGIIQNLELLKNSISNQSIENLVKDIYEYKHVAAFGYLQSECVALNLQYDLQTNRKVIYTCMQFADQIDYIQHADSSHLIIIFSDSGTYFKRAFARTHPFKNVKNKPKIYLITSHREIDLSYVDDYIYYDSGADYASHPYPLIAICGMICSEYSRYLLTRQEND